MKELFEYIYENDIYINFPVKYKIIYGFILEESDLYIHDDLNLYESKITKLPDNLVISGWLNLFRVKIKKLPENLRVYNNLYLYETKIFKLPDSLNVGDYIYVDRSKMKNIITNNPKFADKIR